MAGPDWGGDCRAGRWTVQRPFGAGLRCRRTSAGFERVRPWSALWFAAAVLLLGWPLLPAHAASRGSSSVALHFETDEGTRTNVDVAPDGRTIVFDMVGGIYRAPIGGGRAERLIQSDWAWAHSPRFSPDGKSIAFLTDKAGVQDLWLFDVRSGKQRRISDLEALKMESDTLYPVTAQGASGSPHWLPNGREIAIGLRSVRSRILVFDIATGAARWLDRPPTEQLEAVATAAFGSRPCGGGRIDAHYSTVGTASARQSWPIRSRLFRLDLASGARSQITPASAPYDEFRPEISRNGRWMAYLRQEKLKRTELRLRDLCTDEDRFLTLIGSADDPYRFDQDISEFPGYAFTPDDGAIIIWSGGKLRRVETADGSSLTIPVHVEVRRRIEHPLAGEFRLRDGPIGVRAQRWPTLSRDRKLLAFSALGAIWVRALPGGAARRLPPAPGQFDDMPALSPDGRLVAFVTFRREPLQVAGPSSLVIRSLDRREQDRRINDASFYLPRWSPDGSRLAVLREKDGKAFFGWLAVGDLTFHAIAPARMPREADLRYSHAQLIDWTADGRLIIQRTLGSGLFREKVVAELYGLDGKFVRRVAEAGTDVYGLVVSPGLKRAAMIGWDYQAYVVDLPDPGKGPAELSVRMPGAHRISKLSAMHPRWSNDGSLTFGFMRDVFTWDAGQRTARRVSRTTVSVPRRQGHGSYAIRNARIITAAGQGGPETVLDKGTIVVRDRRILAIGGEDTRIPAGARIIEGAGLTLMPGLVDSHYHDAFPGGRGATFFPAGAPWDGMRRALSFGITTAFEPGGAPADEATPAFQELLETGSVAGVRWLADGGSVTPSANPGWAIRLADVRAQFLRKRALGNGPCLKILGEDNNVRLRLYARVARESGFCLIGHTDTSTQLPTYVMSGIAPHHWHLPTPLYRDMTQFLRRAKMRSSPHLAFSAGTSQAQGSLAAAAIALIRRRVDEETWKWASGLLKGLRRYEALPAADFRQARGMDAIRDEIALMRSGTELGISGDIPISADLRVEMMLFQQAGATPLEIIHSATHVTARQLGLDRDVGSLERGKIADMLVLTRDPSKDVANSLFLKYTIVDGLAYNSQTLRPVNLADPLPGRPRGLSARKRR